MDKAIYHILQAIMFELQSQRISLGEAERRDLQEDAETAMDAAYEEAFPEDRGEPPPASK